MKIAIVDNYDSFTYNLVHYFEALDHEVFVMMHDNIEWNIVDAFDALVLSPGPGLPQESGALMEVIEKYYYSKPILGICLGMQALACYDKMELYNMEQVWHGIQKQIVVDQSSRLFESCASEMEVGLYHSWAVRAVTIPWKSVAQTPEGVIMAMEHRVLQHAAVQFHPESVMTPEGLRILKSWLESIQKELLIA